MVIILFSDSCIVIPYCLSTGGTSVLSSSSWPGSPGQPSGLCERIEGWHCGSLLPSNTSELYQANG